MISFTIQGEPASKANSRRIVTNAKTRRPMVIKSAKARSYFDAARMQSPNVMLEGDLRVSIWIYYATRRPDLDESVILDAMQTRVYANDRQVKEKHVYWRLDRENPRAHVHVEAL